MAQRGHPPVPTRRPHPPSPPSRRGGSGTEVTAINITLPPYVSITPPTSSRRGGSSTAATGLGSTVPPHVFLLSFLAAGSILFFFFVFRTPPCRATQRLLPRLFVIFFPLCLAIAFSLAVRAPARRVSPPPPAPRRTTTPLPPRWHRHRRVTATHPPSHPAHNVAPYPRLLSRAPPPSRRQRRRGGWRRRPLLGPHPSPPAPPPPRDDGCRCARQRAPDPPPRRRGRCGRHRRRRPPPPSVTAPTRRPALLPPPERGRPLVSRPARRRCQPSRRRWQGVAPPPAPPPARAFRLILGQRPRLRPHTTRRSGGARMTGGGTATSPRDRRWPGRSFVRPCAHGVPLCTRLIL